MSGRCLIIGASGQLGRALALRLRPRYTVIEACRVPQAGQVRIDLAHPADTVAAMQPLKPDWIIIAGAFCNVDQAERDRERCMRVNVEGPQAIARYAHTHRCAVVYYSTDQVFDGSQTSYRESNPVNPLNVYAQSKAQGEAMLREFLPERHLVIRTAWLYGPDRARRNFVLRFVDRLADHQPVQVPADQWGTPTYTDDVAAVTQFLMERQQVGIFHAVGPELLTRVSFAHRVCAHFGFEASGVIPVPTETLHQPARRPLRLQLVCERLLALGMTPLNGPEAGLAALRRWQSSAGSM